MCFYLHNVIASWDLEAMHLMSYRYVLLSQVHYTVGFFLSSVASEIGH